MSEVVKRGRFGGLLPHKLMSHHPPLALLVGVMGFGISFCSWFMFRCFTSNPDLQPNVFKSRDVRQRHHEFLYKKYNMLESHPRIPIPVVMKPDGSLEVTDYSRFKLTPVAEK